MARGKMVKEYAFLGGDQEEIAWDDNSCLHIAQDSGGTPSQGPALNQL
jgi:hypothetical protein